MNPGPNLVAGTAWLFAGMVKVVYDEIVSNAPQQIRYQVVRVAYF